MIRLHNPHPVYGYYELADCSRVYPSGCISRPVRPGEWFAWLCTGSEEGKDGRRVAVGEVLMDRRGIRYFLTPEDAARALRRAARPAAKKGG